MGNAPAFSITGHLVNAHKGFLKHSVDVLKVLM
jgi:hypothetical protein